MLLADRRLRVLFICLAAMDAAVFVPFFLLLQRLAPIWRADVTFAPLPLLGLVLGIWAGILAAVAFLEFLSRLRISGSHYVLITLGLLIGSTLLCVRLLLYADAGLGDLRWLGATADTLFNFHRGLRPEFTIILASLFVWQRAISATSRGTRFFSVGMDFRVGLLLLILGGALLYSLLPGYQAESPLLLWFYLGFGLLATAISRLDDKSQQAHGSRGPLLPWPQLALLIAAAAVPLLAAIALSGVFSPQGIRTFLGLFGFLWQLLGDLALLLLQFIFWLLTPLLLLLERLLRALLGNAELPELLRELGNLEFLPQELDENQAAADQIPDWILAGTRYGLVLFVLLVVLGLILLFLSRVERRSDGDEAEESGLEVGDPGHGLLNRGLERLRALSRLLRRYRLGTQLLAAISVQNIYANTSRLARRRGYPRAAAQSPDHYLPQLCLAFPGHRTELEEITAAYMLVHYGDRPITGAELERIRTAYRALRSTTPVPKSQSQITPP